MGIPKAVHLGGGNLFDDVRLDIGASIAGQDAWLRTVEKRSVRRPPAATGFVARTLAANGERLHLREALVQTGVAHGWFDEFCDYWTDSIGGRPLTLMDFHHLRFHYRTRSQYTAALGWRDADEHLRNWQEPQNIAATFMLAYRAALSPPRPHALGKLLRNGMRVLEYGCSIAPAYRTWRHFFAQIRTRWVLADIAGFGFHYARHVYGRDGEAEFATIADFVDPLHDVDGDFDLIVVQEVFEHVDHPLATAGRLIERLRPGGAFVFDYIASDGLGHDTVAGRDERRETLEFLQESLRFENGGVRVDDRSLGLTVGRR